MKKSFWLFKTVLQEEIHLLYYYLTKFEAVEKQDMDALILLNVKRIFCDNQKL